MNGPGSPAAIMCAYTMARIVAIEKTLREVCINKKASFQHFSILSKKNACMSHTCTKPYTE